MLLLVGLASATAADGATIYACVKRNGSIRLVARAARCRFRESKISWNTRGPAGRNGASGKNGANGKNGSTGATGKTGPSGTNGADGADGSSTGSVDFNDGPFELGPLQQAVATLPNVPAGNYILAAKVQVENANKAEGVAVHCFFASDEAVADLGLAGAANSVTSVGLTLMSAARTASTSAFVLECNDFGTTGVKVAFARIAAIQVQTLSATNG